MRAQARDRRGTMTTMTDHPFDTDTRVEPAGERTYRATLTDSWNALGGVPNGGYLLAVCLNALANEMPLPDPVVVSATYLRPAARGPAELRTELVRAGRRVATGEVRLLQDGREIVRAVATFADLDKAEGRTMMRSAPPELPAPEQAHDVIRDAPPLPGVNITERFEYRAPQLPGWARGEPTGDADLAFWLRFRGGRDADPIELTVHIRARPRPDGSPAGPARAT